MASEACPVCCLIFQDAAPDRAALVANPARKLCPNNPTDRNRLLKPFP
jgi:hypothetical protein